LPEHIFSHSPEVLFGELRLPGKALFAQAEKIHPKRTGRHGKSLLFIQAIGINSNGWLAAYYTWLVPDLIF
jgi:hypothetical protein